MVNIHKKVSTSFRAIEGAERMAFCVLHRNGESDLDPLAVLVRLVHG